MVKNSLAGRRGVVQERRSNKYRNTRVNKGRTVPDYFGTRKVSSLAGRRGVVQERRSNNYRNTRVNNGPVPVPVFFGPRNERKNIAKMLSNNAMLAAQKRNSRIRRTGGIRIPHAKGKPRALYNGSGRPGVGLFGLPPPPAPENLIGHNNVEYLNYVAHSNALAADMERLRRGRQSLFAVRPRPREPRLVGYFGNSLRGRVSAVNKPHRNQTVIFEANLPNNVIRTIAKNTTALQNYNAYSGRLSAINKRKQQQRRSRQGLAKVQRQLPRVLMLPAPK